MNNHARLLTRTMSLAIETVQRETRIGGVTLSLDEERMMGIHVRILIDSPSFISAITYMRRTSWSCQAVPLQFKHTPEKRNCISILIYFRSISLLFSAARNVGQLRITFLRVSLHFITLLEKRGKKEKSRYLVCSTFHIFQVISNCTVSRASSLPAVRKKFTRIVFVPYYFSHPMCFSCWRGEEWKKTSENEKKGKKCHFCWETEQFPSTHLPINPVH